VEAGVSNLFLVSFDDENTAFLMHTSLVRLHRHYPIEMDDVLVVARDEQSELTVYKTVGLSRSTTEQMPSASIGDEFRELLEQTVQSGTSALFALMPKSAPPRVLELLKSFKGRSSITPLTKEEAQELRLLWARL
jgi:uncharacterized membrane protein